MNKTQERIEKLKQEIEKLEKEIEKLNIENDTSFLEYDSEIQEKMREHDKLQAQLQATEQTLGEVKEMIITMKGYSRKLNNKYVDFLLKSEVKSELKSKLNLKQVGS